LNAQVQSVPTDRFVHHLMTISYTHDEHQQAPKQQAFTPAHTAVVHPTASCYCSPHALTQLLSQGLVLHVIAEELRVGHQAVPLQQQQQKKKRKGQVSSSMSAIRPARRHVTHTKASKRKPDTLYNLTSKRQSKETVVSRSVLTQHAPALPVSHWSMVHCSKAA
jgi:hypothetical protein